MNRHAGVGRTFPKSHRAQKKKFVSVLFALYVALRETVVLANVLYQADFYSNLRRSR
jgi:hypothetical protein